MTEPKFSANARPVLAEAVAVFDQRGRQHGDTWRDCQWRVAQAVATELGDVVAAEHWRAIAAAVMVDIKYQRNQGGWHEDNHVDGINYAAFLVGEMRALKSGA